MHAIIVMRALKPQILYIHYGKLAEQWLIEMQSMLFVNINDVLTCIAKVSQQRQISNHTWWFVSY